ncbi:MAG: type II secretion system F family protein [Phycisphaerales bacterium]|nr:type II secretion system F family protein [Planctomycetota bacterium]
MNYTYSGFDAQGKPIDGVIESTSPAEASEALRKQGIFTVRVQAGGDTPHKANALAARGGRGAGLREISLFFRQLAILVSTKTPLVQALEVLEKQAPEAGWRSVIHDIRRRVEQGESFSAAMASHPKSFDPVCRSMVAAGESGGVLDQMLRSLAALARQRMSVRRGVIGALTYPAILITVSFAVVIVLLVTVLPQFSELFDSLQTPLPPTTKLLIATSDVLRRDWPWLVPAALAGIAAIGFWLRSAAGKRAVDRAVVTLPRIGPIRRSFAMAGVARLLGTLLEARVNLLDALKLTRESLTSDSYASLLAKCEAAVEKGVGLADAINDPLLVSPAVREAIASGERSGQIGPVLLQIAEFLDEDNEQFVKMLSALIEPFVLTIMGVLVGGVAISMFLPLFDLAANAGGGGAAP